MNLLDDIKDWLHELKIKSADLLLAAARWTVWSPWRLAAVVGTVVVAVLIVGQLRASPSVNAAGPTPAADQASNWPRATAQPNPGQPNPGQAAPGSTPKDSPAPQNAPTETSPTTGRDLSGEKLAQAWLTGFLTRSSRTDTSWTAAIADITDPELLSALEAEGSDAVGLLQLQTWRVTQVRRSAGAGAKPVDTPSRQVLAYTATVTDGTHTAQKPFVLYAFGSGGRWLVTLVEQPYTSEG